MSKRASMASVSHVHPDTHEPFWSMYRRGPAMADGGRRRSGSDSTNRRDGTMADVSHESPYSETANLWTRGVSQHGGGEGGV